MASPPDLPSSKRKADKADLWTTSYFPPKETPVNRFPYLIMFSLLIGCGGGGDGAGGVAPPDTFPPTVSSTSPANGAIGVVVNAAISVTFSEPINPATITGAAFSVKAGTVDVPGTISCSGTTATFTPTGKLAYSTVYNVTITTGVKDLSGNALANNYGSGFTTTSSDSPPGAVPTVTVRPIETSDILYNPGMGFADFHFGWGHPPPSNEYPPQTIAYFRWTWDELEPSEGQYNFGLVDSVIQQAKAKGETLAFRIMSVFEGSTPKWVRDKGVDSVTVGGDIFPDHNNAVFLDYHERLVKAFGNRYAGKPEIDHVDIGSVGCWGEWNTACCGSSEALCNRYLPTDQNKLRITDWYFQYFPGTPLVMLVGGPIEYAASKGAGWRGDCFGDYGMFEPTWNHMVNVYEPAVRIPVVSNAWKAAPVQFEVCGVMQDWYDKGFNIDLILQKGLDWHMTVLNAKSSPVPAAWRPKVDEFLKKVGYRFVLQELIHSTEARPGGSMTIRSHWANKGVAPIYHPWPLAYRLRSNTDQVVASWKSAANLMFWLPGTHEVDDVVTIPSGVPAATYALDVAILTEDAKDAHVEIAIVGKRLDKWYPVSEVTIRN